ncbi:hypothetical protein PVK06_003515 [Gossypium arboreum]|uniref:Uncharacterized protein n=1 Tax=Gossypium arboreum TaxID=29729 RepID=A0ABR0R6G3_GOSAR|nr:hypothetical protein PVK06_003515 [Gossypium arboreum]
MENMIEQMLRNNGWKGGRECQENYKKMGGSLDGSIKIVKMDPSATRAGIGKQENKENGMDVQIYLVYSMKNLLIPLNDPDFNFRSILRWSFQETFKVDHLVGVDNGKVKV